MLDFQEIDNITDNRFDEAMEIYIESFPPNERHNIERIKKRLSNSNNRLIVGLLKKSVVLVALIWSLMGTDFILFDYLAVKKEFRNKGFGTYFMEHVLDILKIKNKYLVLEVEDPRYGNNKDDRSRRLEFYKRIGAKQLKDVKYILPPLSGPGPTDMVLMMMPEYKSGKISGKLVKNIIIRIYKELYGRDEDDELLNSFINNIPRNVELIGK